MFSVALLDGMGLLETKVLGKRVGGLEGSTELLTVELGVTRARSYGDTRIGRSGATMWKIVSKETTFKGGEHHTRGTGTDDKDRVLAIAMARGLSRTEKGR